MSRPAPLWLVFLVQGTSVVGDTLGQRATRLHFKGSSRRMLMALTIVSALQVLVILGALQAFLPASVSGAIYDSSGDQLPCYREVDWQGRLPSYCSGAAHNCTVVPCPSQGPASVPRSIGLHPLLLLNGLQSIVYYIGEVLLYQQPMGLVLIVMASLVSSFVIAPFEALFGIHEAHVPPTVIGLGIVGAVACVVELPLSHEQQALPLRKLYGAAWRALRRGDWRAVCGRQPQTGRSCSTGVDVPAYRPLDAIADYGPKKVPLSAAVDEPAEEGNEEEEGESESVGGHVLRIAVPFVMLALIYSAWFVTQKVFNAEYRTNMYGYTSLDQVMGPLYLLPTLFLIDRIGPLRRSLVPAEDRVRARPSKHDCTHSLTHTHIHTHTLPPVVASAQGCSFADDARETLRLAVVSGANTHTNAESRTSQRIVPPYGSGRPRRLHVAGVHLQTAH